jgi:hypothetical protein
MTLATNQNMTIAGILSLIGAAAVALVPMFDNDPTTAMNWGAFISLVITGILGILGKGQSTTGGTVDPAGKPVP